MTKHPDGHKGELLWKILTLGVLIIILWGAMGVVQSTINGDYDCPIIRDNGTEMVFCFSVNNWTEYCEDIGCQSQRFWCGRPGCQCQEEFFQ